ncbi:hypothetical protein CLOM_g15603 [Closterium sp. NIES-68]|nr:hypothetical protein CLOM_g15603 [Closterium sp. NIES-68]
MPPTPVDVLGDPPPLPRPPVRLASPHAFSPVEAMAGVVACIGAVAEVLDCLRPPPLQAPPRKPEAGRSWRPAMSRRQQRRAMEAASLLLWRLAYGLPPGAEAGELDPAPRAVDELNRSLVANQRPAILAACAAVLRALESRAGALVPPSALEV